MFDQTLVNAIPLTTSNFRKLDKFSTRNGIDCFFGYKEQSGKFELVCVRATERKARTIWDKKMQGTVHDFGAQNYQAYYEALRKRFKGVEPENEQGFLIISSSSEEEDSGPESSTPPSSSPPADSPTKEQPQGFRELSQHFFDRVRTATKSTFLNQFSPSI